MTTVKADLMLRTSDNLVLTTLESCDAPAYVDDAVTVIDIRSGVEHPAHVAQIDERAHHVMLRMDNDPTSRLELFRAENAFQDLLNEAQSRARRAYDTGNRIQSAECIRDHLSRDEREDLIKADRFCCPTCGHLLKDRSR